MMRSPSLLLRCGVQAAGGLLSPAGRRGQLLILMYHRVLAQADALLPDEPDAASFATQIEWVAKLFHVLPLSEALARLHTHSLPARAACITFDDGYLNNLTVALPILQRLQLPATVFIATEFIDGSCMWNDVLIEAVRFSPTTLDLSHLGLGVYALTDMAARRAALTALLERVKYLEPAMRLRCVADMVDRAGMTIPRHFMLSATQIRQLHAAGVEIGAHTVTHPILTRITAAQAQAEIINSKHCLETIIDAPVTLFAYPNGRPGRDYTAAHVAMVRQAGFTAAVSTAWGALRPQMDSMQIPRIAPWDKTATRFAARMLHSYLQPEVQVC